MKSPGHFSNKTMRRRFAEQSAFTLLELLVASSCGALVIASALVFMNFAHVSVSGIMAQSMVSDTAAHAVAYMQSRIRFATSITTDASGKTLTLGFDDDYTVDSDGDGSPYNDKDHYETVQFTGTSGTNWATASSNRLIYTPKVGVAGSSVLVPFGVRNLPGYNIFTIANTTTVLIRFGVVDSASRDRFQSIDIQATGVPLNRPASASFISVLP
jgi:hypothetical protein